MEQNKPAELYNYWCRVVKVIDGDTIDVDILLGFDLEIKNARVRLFGIDAPETRSADPEEKRFGLYTKAFVEKLMPPGLECVLVSQVFQREKFGRILGDFRFEHGGLLSNVMTEGWVAIKYTPTMSAEDKRTAHAQNRWQLTRHGLVV